MKITLQLSFEEAKTLILDGLNIGESLRENATLRIVRKAKPLNEDLVIFNEIERTIGQTVQCSANKIENITKVQEIFFNHKRECSFYEAKCIVEKFSLFVRETIQNKRLYRFV